LTRLPSALFVIDVSKEHIAVREAKRLGIPVFAMVDTNSDPTDIEFPIPANDDASKSISLIVGILCQAIEEGLNERKIEKDKEPQQKDKKISRKDIDTKEISAALIEAMVEEDETEEEEADIEADIDNEDSDESEEEDIVKLLDETDEEL
jgi:small subunit ribosomal protein S2